MRGEEMCVLPPSPRNLHPGKCERAFGLSMFSSDGSRLPHLDFVFMTLFLLLLPPYQCTPRSPAACIFSFGTISALYTQSANAKLSLCCCQCSSALCVFGSVIGSNEQQIECICSASLVWTQQQAPLQSHVQPPFIRPLLGSRLPKWLSSKESTCQCRRLRRWGHYPWVGKTPWNRAWQSTPAFLPGKSHCQSLVGYSDP